MPDPGERQRTVLRAPRVEFDLSALLLGAGGYLAYQWSWAALAYVLGIGGEVAVGSQKWPGHAALRSEFFDRLFGFVGLPLQYTGPLAAMIGYPGPMSLPSPRAGEPRLPFSLGLEWWKFAVVAIWLLVLWSIVGGAIARVCAVRIARDESIGATDGLAFSFANLRSFVMAPLFVACAALLFFVVSSLAALACTVPYAGPFLSVVLYPVVIATALVVAVIAAGGVFGFPMLQTALATERNGTLDAISRTFSYVFTRPVAFVASVLSVVVVAGILGAFGGAFIGFAARAIEAGGTWNPFGGGEDFRTEGAKAMATGWQVGVLGGFFALPNLENVDVFVGTWRVVAWFFTALAALAVNGFVLSYFVGGLTDTYFMLRRDVDGIDDSEVYVDEEEKPLPAPLPGEPAPPSQGG